jgi:hypothetical protein
MVTAKQFYPGIIEYSGRISAGYNSGRALSAAAAAAWAGIVAPVVRSGLRVDQATAASLREFAEHTRFLADTVLALISDSEFQEGQVAIETAAAQEHVASSVVERIELLVFENDRCENVV